MGEGTCRRTQSIQINLPFASLTPSRPLDGPFPCLRQAIAHPDDHYHPSSANGDYVSAFPCVGLVVWQAGFVLADWLLRTKPLGPWNAPVRVLELGCGTGGRAD